MYNSYEFTYAGIPSSTHGMFVCDIGNQRHEDNPFGNRANIVEKRIAKRISPIHYGVRYHDEPLSFSLIFGGDHGMDRYEMQAVAKWLTGYQEYQWLTIDQPDLAHVQFRCLIQSLTPISAGWMPVAFRADILCDCPYGYSHPFSQSYQINGGTTIRIYNDGTCREPISPALDISVYPGCTAFSLENKTTGDGAMMFSGLPGRALDISVDNENGVITEEQAGLDMYDYFNFQFLTLAPGDNEITCHGQGEITVSGRYLYNVGA